MVVAYSIAVHDGAADGQESKPTGSFAPGHIGGDLDALVAYVQEANRVTGSGRSLRDTTSSPALSSLH